MVKDIAKEFLENPWSWANTFIGLAGLIAVLTVVNILSIFFKWLSPAIVTSIWLFIALPVVITFTIGLFRNKPNVQIRAKKFGFVIYTILALIGFFIFIPPTSFMGFWKLLGQFFIGFVITFVAGTVFLFFFKVWKDKSYRFRAGFSFLISLAVILALIFLTKDATWFKELIS